MYYFNFNSVYVRVHMVEVLVSSKRSKCRTNWSKLLDSQQEHRCFTLLPLHVYAEYM